MATRTRTVGEYAVELIAANGIDTVFGIPGVHNLELYRGLSRQGLRHVLVHHEQNAGFCADGFARMSGRPAAAFVISGPGLTNILTALGQAWADSVPVLVIASTPPRGSLGKRWGVLHELKDQRALAEGVCQVARSARTAEDVRDHLRAAFAALRAPRPRPAYVEIPLDLLAEPTALAAERFAPPEGVMLPAPAAMERAVAMLRAARRPLLIAGGGARYAGPAIAALVDQLDAYLVTTAAAKGILPERHPANLGASLPYRATQTLIASADVVLATGTELSETDSYFTLKLQIDGELIRVDVDPAKLADHYGAKLALRADARACLDSLTRASLSSSGWRRDQGGAPAHRERIAQQFDALAQACIGALQALRAGLPDDAAVMADMTQIAYQGAYSFPVDAPGLWHVPSGYGTLGYALPAALGAKLAAPERAVVALAGDFGLQFTLHELSTAVELGCTLPIVLWNNDCLGQIRDDMVRAGIGLVGVAARNPDFCALAQACGAAAQRVREPAALTRAVRTALGHAGPTVIEVDATAFGAPGRSA